MTRPKHLFFEGKNIECPSRESYEIEVLTRNGVTIKDEDRENRFLNDVINTASVMPVQTVINIYEAMVAKFGSKLTQTYNTLDQICLFQNEMEDFRESYFNWNDPFEISIMILYGVTFVY